MVKVGELIEKLKGFDPDILVLVRDIETIHLADFDLEVKKCEAWNWDKKFEKRLAYFLVIDPTERSEYEVIKD